MSIAGKLWLGIAVGLLVVGAARESDACGGFFCNNSQPVDQTGEKILFIVDEAADRVTAHVQIQYSGASQDFSWVVPVSSVPEIDVGTDEVFSRLFFATQPSYRIERSTRGECDTCPYAGGDADADGDTDADTDADADADSDADGVLIVDSGVVGPYETVTLSSDDPQALEDWLAANGYDIPATAGPIIAAYVAADFYFVGLKLTKDADVGDLQPIVLRMSGTAPCIPLRLTAIAATPDMQVFAWVLGNSRAVSTNYLDVVPNDVFVFSGEMDHATAARTAIEAAGGRAFVTDFAGSAVPFRSALDSAYDTERIRPLDSPADVVSELRFQGMFGSALLYAILEQYMPPPAGVDAPSFYACPDCYDLTGYTFDADALADALEARIARPLEEVHDEFWMYSTLTRLYTVISPGEMTEDPEFAMTDAAPSVDTVRTAQVVRDCRGTISTRDDYGEATTPAGHRFCGPNLDSRAEYLGYSYQGYDGGQTLGYDVGPLPVLETATSYASGGPALVVDERDAIADALQCDIPRLDNSAGTCGGDADADSDVSAVAGSGSLCALAPGRAGWSVALAVVALAALFIARRRRRARA
jgi:hypothetical protein